MWSPLDIVKETEKAIGVMALVVLLITGIMVFPTAFADSNRTENYETNGTTQGTVTDVYTDLFSDAQSIKQR